MYNLMKICIFSRMVFGKTVFLIYEKLHFTKQKNERQNYFVLIPAKPRASQFFWSYDILLVVSK